jgi:hypothetical protein
MVHVTCDLCGKEIQPGDDHHFVVKIEVFTAGNPANLTEADLDEDHIEAVSELIREIEEGLVEGGDAEAPSTQQMRYDLCPGCRKKYVRDPLGRETAQKFDFSEN